MRVRRVAPRILIVVPAVTALGLSACGGDTDEAVDTTVVANATATAEGSAAATDSAGVALTVSDPWSRQPAEGQTVTAVYGVVANAGDADVTIVAATSPVSDDVQLHETLMGDDGTMSMKEKEGGFTVPAGGEFVFESGGPHIMLMGIDAATYPATVEVTFALDSGETVTFTAEVRSIDGMDIGHDESMSASGTDMGHASAGQSESTSESTSESGDHGSAAVDAAALHEIDEQLAAGRLDAATQQPIVAEAIEALTLDGEPDVGTPEAELLTILRDLDAALGSGDVAEAAEAAAAVHDAAHALDESH